MRRKNQIIFVQSGLDSLLLKFGVNCPKRKMNYMINFLVEKFHNYCVGVKLIVKVKNELKKHFRKEFFGKKILSVSNLESFLGVGGLVEAYTHASPSYTETPRPEVYPKKDTEYLESPHSKYIFPEIRTYCLSGASLFGRSDFICWKGVFVHDGLFNPHREYAQAEYAGRAALNHKRDKMVWLQKDPEPVYLSVGAHFLSGCDANYAHWLTEVLPKISVFCSDKTFADVPLIISAGLHPNIQESVRKVAGEERKIIFLEKNKMLYAKKLYVTSSAGYVPFEPRKQDRQFFQGIFSSYALEKMRQLLMSDAIPDNIDFPPKKIYLRRISTMRNITNVHEVEKLLTRRGYVPVEPEKLTFNEQVSLFENAQSIISATGAGLANIVFCRPGTQICVLSRKYSTASYWYWQNIACATGNVITYVLGGHVKKRHEDYAINLRDLNDYLDTLKDKGVAV